MRLPNEALRKGMSQGQTIADASHQQACSKVIMVNENT